MSSVGIIKSCSLSDTLPYPSSKSITLSVSEFYDDPKEIKISKDKPKKKKTNIFLRIILWILNIFLFIVIAYTIWTLIYNHRERKTLEKYAKTHANKIEIDGHMMNHNIVGESNNITIIALPGFATYAPVIEFKSLYDSLSDKFRVVVPEPFGYGFSDVVDKERSLENVVSELHELASKLGISKYYLMGHSLGGLYCLNWANQFTNEILGYIGLDCSVPGQESLDPKDSINDSIFKRTRIARDLGLIRVKSLISKEEILTATDFNYKNLTKEEIEINRLIAINNGYNDDIINEAKQISVHLDKLRNVKFPDSVPVLNLVTDINYYTKEKVDPLWIKLHYDVITNKNHSKVVIISGGHFLHITHKDEVVKEIKEWVN